jgi:hypothetical protein
MSVKELRPAILDKCNTIQALCAFNYQFTPQLKSHLDEIRSEVSAAPANRLRLLRDHLDQNIERVVDTFGCVVKPKKFADGFIASIRHSPTGTVHLSKAIVDSAYFKNFCGGHPTWKSFPPHLQLLFDFNRVDTDQIRFDFYLMEAMLYEDMALSYNAAAGSAEVINRRDKTANIEVKKHFLHLRTAVLSAYYFVEAYLNGIAFDYYYRNEPKLNDKEKKDLMEWDFQTSRRAFVNFERKVLDYQKIILGLQHPQITITSSKNLRLILGEAKELRDSIVHQSPKTDDALKVSKKVLWMLALRIGHVAEIVDAAIGVVRELNDAFGKNGMPLNWLYSRVPETGLFPPESFT